MSKNKTCFVSVVVNPGQPRRYVLTKTLDVHEKLDLYIQIKNADSDLDYITNILKSDLIISKNYNVIFNFKSVPKSVETNQNFKNAIIKMFQTHTINTNCTTNNTKNTKNVEYNTDSMTNVVKSYIEEYGKAPNFEKIYLDSHFRKCANYIKNILNIENLSDEIIYDIISKITY